jgi:CheY-like chemotaxis protein
VLETPVDKFGSVAIGLSRNPLGIIALFIVLVYGFAALTLTFAGSLKDGERLVLVSFLAVFPVLVLGVFTWLVIGHSRKLFGPADFRNEENFVRVISAAVSLTAAQAKSPSGIETEGTNRVVQAIRHAAGTVGESRRDGWRRRILWVDDRPENNVHVRKALEAFGIEFTLSLNTKDALHQLGATKFAVIISDMGRKEGPREGYVLLDRIRQDGNDTPLFFYAGSSSPAHRKETAEHGGQGCTNDADELFEMVMRRIVAETDGQP